MVRGRTAGLVDGSKWTLTVLDAINPCIKESLRASGRSSHFASGRGPCLGRPFLVFDMTSVPPSLSRLSTGGRVSLA